MRLKPGEPPTLAAWGAGVDSTAMIIELVARGEAPDAVLLADTGSERRETERFVPAFRRWMDEHGVENHIMRYEPKQFRHWPPYHSLLENHQRYAALDQLQPPQLFVRSWLNQCPVSLP